MRAPSKTVKSGTVSGAVATLLVFAVGAIWPDLEIPATVSAALGVIAAAIGSWIVRDPARRPNDDGPKH